MAQSDRQRLLARALALPKAEPSDFFGDRRPPEDADAELLKRIDDTSLRTKLVEARLAEGLQSPKGPQKIASILRIYPDFDAPLRASSNARSNGRSGERNNGRRDPTRGGASNVPQQRGLPSVEELELLLRRIREVEREVGHELGAQIDERIAGLKRALADLDGDDLERSYRELGEALQDKRALVLQIRFETFRRIESDDAFAPRAFLRLLRR
jgi:hypothetical protein